MTNHFRNWNLQLRPSRSHNSKKSVSHEGSANVFMCHKLIRKEVLRKYEQDY